MTDMFGPGFDSLQLHKLIAYRMVGNFCFKASLLFIKIFNTENSDLFAENTIPIYNSMFVMKQ